MSKKSILAAVALGAALAFPARGADAAAAPRRLKVLMIGNSFSICVLKHAPQCAKDAGVELDLASLYIGGCSLERHWSNVEKAATDESFAPYYVTWHYDSAADQTKVPFAANGALRKPAKDGLSGEANIPAMLAADRWDVVTIQQASHFSWDPKTYEPYAGNLIAKIRALAPQAEIVIQETWSYCTADGRICKDGGPGSWGFDQQGMYNRLRANYADLAARYGLRRIPTGTAVQNYRRAAGVKDPRADVVGNFSTGKDGKERVDTIHLNPAGEYLQACVWTGTLFGVDAAALRYAPADLDPGRAAALRRAAQEACAAYRAEKK